MDLVLGFFLYLVFGKKGRNTIWTTQRSMGRAKSWIELFHGNPKPFMRRYGHRIGGRRLNRLLRS